MVQKIISGGQTGADLAALDIAIKLGIPHGGAIPKGRLTENGPLPPQYRLEELPTRSYPERTEKNVVDADGTVILSHGPLTGGSLFTEKMAQRHGKPVMHLDMAEVPVEDAAVLLKDFIEENSILILNVAGSRGSNDPAIYGKTCRVLETCILALS